MPKLTAPYLKGWVRDRADRAKVLDNNFLSSQMQEDVNGVMQEVVNGVY